MGIPVVLDMAENYPAMIQDLGSRKFRLMDLFLRNPVIVRVVEKITIRYVDHIVVVVEESKYRLIELGVPLEKISVVMNTPTLERFNGVTCIAPISTTQNRRGNLTVIYLGLLEWARGLETAIRAIHKIQPVVPQLKLVVVGSGRDEAYFKSLVAELNLNEHIQFVGWLDYTEAIKRISSADIGLVPHHATASWNTTIPNKLFDYMSMAKPVIVSNAKPTERVVLEEKCGVVFNEKDFKALGDAIKMLSDQNVRESQGRRGRDAVISKYNWTVDEKRLFWAVEKVACTGNVVGSKEVEGRHIKTERS